MAILFLEQEIQKVLFIVKRIQWPNFGPFRIQETCQQVGTTCQTFDSFNLLLVVVNIQMLCLRTHDCQFETSSSEWPAREKVRSGPVADAISFGVDSIIRVHPTRFARFPSIFHLPLD